MSGENSGRARAHIRIQRLASLFARLARRRKGKGIGVMPEIGLASAEWLVCERYCRRFEAAWGGGATPSLEEFLPAADDPLRDSVLRELVHLDLEYRLKMGLSARVEDYLRRYPQFDDAQYILELIEEEYTLR